MIAEKIREGKPVLTLGTYRKSKKRENICKLVYVFTLFDFLAFSIALKSHFIHAAVAVIVLAKLQKAAS